MRKLLINYIIHVCCSRTYTYPFFGIPGANFPLQIPNWLWMGIEIIFQEPLNNKTFFIVNFTHLLQEKDRRIDLLRGRKRNSKRQPVSRAWSWSQTFSLITEVDTELTGNFLILRPASLHYQQSFFQQLMMMRCLFIPTLVKLPKWLVQFKFIMITAMRYNEANFGTSCC